LHPQVPPTHAVPAAFPAQLTQPGPQADGDVSGVHALPTQQYAAPHVPSPVCPHAEVHVAPATHVGVAPEQPAHAAPVSPHAPFPVPAAHCPPSGSQQPPLHAVSLASPQAVPHACVVRSQAWPVGQSVDAVHPHASVDGMQWGAPALPVQSTQAPDPPHALSLVPGWHVEPVPQQPALHGAVGEQTKMQRPVEVSQPALLAGQSTALAHPHWPPPVTGSHTSPALAAANAAVHEVQTPPLSPQVAVCVPAWQVPPVAALQHPPLQGCDVPHAVVHVLLVVSHACPAGQSDAVWQPHFAGVVAPRHTEPLALPVHTSHAGLPVSHAAAVVPALHVPAALQHPPLHAVSAVPPHAVEHAPVAVSHAMTAGQSLALVQPDASAVASAPASTAGASVPSSIVASWPAS
jgi:hypothetical protein